MKNFFFPSLFLSALSFIGLPGCSTTAKDLPPQSTVGHVDIQRYMGPWRVIAAIPTSFETDAYNPVESYNWNEKEKRIDINYSFNKKSFDGPKKEIPQKGFIDNEQTNAEWLVRPFWPLSFSYLIINLAPDYSDVVVGVPSRKHVWIMSRQPEMSADRYKELVNKVSVLGYDTSKLQKFPQSTLTP